MIQTAFYDAPYGRYVMAAEDGALTGVWLEGQKYFPSGLPEPSDGESEIFAHTRRWLDAYFVGRQPDVSTLPMAPKGSAFAQSVWQLLLEIPYGQTVTYGELAKRLAERRAWPICPPRRWAAPWAITPFPLLSPATGCWGRKTSSPAMPAGWT